jgi:hypothetical protein
VPGEKSMTHECPAWLLEFQSDIFSQAGEDGVILKVLDVLKNQDQWCVEFGAWDGVHLSNTRNLIENHGYSAVLIEGNKERFDDLRGHYATRDSVFPINAYVGLNKSDGLDQILGNTRVPEDFDLLSIDIDGNDYHVWRLVQRYKPKIVCIEFNPTIHTDIEFVQPADPNVNQGASLSALVRLGKDKGYELVCVLRFNAIFVRSSCFGLFEINDNSPAVLRKDHHHVTYIFSGFDGKIFLRGNKALPWHGISLKESEMQRLPRLLRIFPGKYTFLRRVFLKVFRMGRF